MDDESFKRLVAVIRQQQVTQLQTMACLLEIVKIVPPGESRGAYLERIEGLLEGMNKQHDLVNHLTGEDADDDGGENAI